MTEFSEWQQLSQTRSFVQSLKSMKEQIKEEAVTPGHLTVEQLAISAIELKTEARVLNDIINKLTSKEDKE